jgi:hypothetical protein
MIGEAKFVEFIGFAGAPTSGGGGAPAPFDPVSLFGASDHGAIIDMTDASLLFQSNAGTGAVSADNDPVGYATDLGPDAKPVLQSTAASKPSWSGAPRTLGSELVTNPLLSADTDWTKGTDWTITGGAAVKTAGVASVLSQAISLTAGKSYFVTYEITRTAGTLTARFTGGTNVTGTARSYNGSYVDLLTAVTGNTTLEFSADTTFAGSVKVVSVKEVASWVTRGPRFDGSDDALQSATNDLSGSDKGTLVAAFQVWQNAQAAVVAEHGNFGSNVTGSFHIGQISGWAGRLRGDTASATVTAATAEAFTTLTNQSNVVSVVVDLAGASIADEIDIRVRGIAPTEVTSGTTAGGGNLANGALTVGRAFSNLRFPGVVRRVILINRELTADEIVQAENWCRDGMVIAAQLGDSVTAPLNSTLVLPQAMPIHSLVGGMICGAAAIAKAGDRIADQLTLWNALPSKTALEAVFIGGFHNDIKGRVGEGTATIATVMADLQSLIGTVRAAVSASCKIYVCAAIPCKAWLDGATNPAAAYQAWLDYNDAIAGNGANAITGVDGRITSYVATLNDGSGNLAAEYDMDGVHENNAARFIIAQAWRTQLEADGLVS